MRARVCGDHLDSDVAEGARHGALDDARRTRLFWVDADSMAHAKLALCTCLRQLRKALREQAAKTRGLQSKAAGAHELSPWRIVRKDGVDLEKDAAITNAELGFVHDGLPARRARRMLSAASIGPSASRVRIEASFGFTGNLR